MNQRNEPFSAPIRIINATFMRGADESADLPLTTIPEVAFIGRTNVGKSTLINRVTGRRSIARASSTPGRTQQFNLYQAEIVEGEHRWPIVFVDLPGFGYSQFSKKKRVALEKATVTYLTQRPSLSLICLLNDIRRDPEEDELFVASIARERDIPLITVITKGDKLATNEAMKRRREIERHFCLPAGESCLTGTKVDAGGLIARILREIQPG